MENREKIFHLAIPCENLKEAEAFYSEKLGIKVARRYDDRITLNFFGDQVVCHFAPDDIDTMPKIYPRHFGMTFANKDEFNSLLEMVREGEVPMFKELFVRFEGLKEEHRAFFIKDPSNNLIEFKWYKDRSMMY
jgi:uncharacterized protein